MKRLFAVALCLVLALGLVACEQRLTDEEIDKIADRVAAAPMHEEDITRLTDALLSHPVYLEYLNSDELTEEVTRIMANTMLEHPAFQVTPEKECAQTILMAAVIAGLPDLPKNPDSKKLCDWYEEQVQ